VSTTLKSGRVMVKDEDVCLHCGLCAERCPTGAWDMQKFLLLTAKAGDGRARAGDGGRMKRIEAVNERLRHQVRQRQRLGLGLGQRAVRQGGAAHGRAGQPAQHLPEQHPGPADLVRGARVRAGLLGRRGGVDMMVAMNPQTWDADVAEIEPGGYLLYDSTRPLPPGEPARRRARRRRAADRDLPTPPTSDPRQRQLFKNIIYVGVLSALLDIDRAVFESLFAEQYRARSGCSTPTVGAAARARIRARARPGADRAARAGAPTGRRPHLRRRQQRHRAGLRLRRRHGLRLVPDHALVVGRRGVPEVLREVPRRPGHGGTASRSCRPRTSWPRSAWWSAPAGTARAPSPPPRGRASR
jgi:ferredoxin